RRDVQDAALRHARDAQELLPMTHARLVGADALSRDLVVEGDPDALERAGEKRVVHVGKDRRPVAGRPQALQGRRGLRKRPPIGETADEGARGGSAQRLAALLEKRGEAEAEDIAVAPVARLLEAELEPGVAAD